MLIVANCSALAVLVWFGLGDVGLISVLALSADFWSGDIIVLLLYYWSLMGPQVRAQPSSERASAASARRRPFGAPTRPLALCALGGCSIAGPHRGRRLIPLTVHLLASKWPLERPQTSPWSAR